MPGLLKSLNIMVGIISGFTCTVTIVFMSNVFAVGCVSQK